MHNTPDPFLLARFPNLANIFSLARFPNFANIQVIVLFTITLWVSLTHADVQFTRVTEKAGIQFRHFNGATGEKHLVETMGGSAAFFDYNNDDNLDIYLVNGAPLTKNVPDVLPTNHLYQNNGDGTFTDVTLQAGVGDTSYGIGCCVADYNNDGNRDLFVTNFGQNILYQNNGNGTFTNVSGRAGLTSESTFLLDVPLLTTTTMAGLIWL